MAGNLASRLLIAAAGLPIVLGLVWAGGWWLFAFALVVGVLALHDYAKRRRRFGGR